MGDGGGDGSQSGGKSGSGTGDPIQIKVGDETREFTHEQIAQSLERMGSLEKTVESLSGFQKLLRSYGVGAEEYLKNSEAAFAIASSLIEQGIIDQEGNVITKKGDPPEGDEKDKLLQFKVGSDSEVTRQFKAVATALEKITGRIDELDKGQTNIYRNQLERDLKGTHKNLDRGDVSKILTTAQQDRSKSLWDHAAEYASDKEARESQTKNTMAKEIITSLTELGIIDKSKLDVTKLEKFDLNALKEQNADGGIPSYTGKRFMFGSRQKKLGLKKDEVVSPADASHEFLSKR